MFNAIVHALHPGIEKDTPAFTDAVRKLLTEYCDFLRRHTTPDKLAFLLKYEYITTQQWIGNQPKVSQHANETHWKGEHLTSEGIQFAKQQLEAKIKKLTSATGLDAWGMVQDQRPIMHMRNYEFNIITLNQKTCTASEPLGGNSGPKSKSTFPTPTKEIVLQWDGESHYDLVAFTIDSKKVYMFPVPSGETEDARKKRYAGWCAQLWPGRQPVPPRVRHPGPWAGEALE
jgi:hypothetical protein